MLFRSREYMARRDAFVEALRKHTGSALTYEVPRGGMALWAGLPGRRGAEEVIARALARGVVVQSTRGMCFDGRDRPALRLGFAGHAVPLLREAARRLGAALRP